MTGTPEVIPEVISSGPPRRPRSTTQSPAILKEAVVTVAAIAAVSTLALATLPVAPTPQRVAEAFVTARFDEDWAGAYALLCASDQDWVDYESFADRAARRFDLGSAPFDVDVELGETRPARGPADPQFTVPLTLTLHEQDGQRVIDSSIPLVAENGTVRVCFSAVGRGA